MVDIDPIVSILSVKTTKINDIPMRTRMIDRHSHSDSILILNPPFASSNTLYIYNVHLEIQLINKASKSILQKDILLIKLVNSAYG